VAAVAAVGPAIFGLVVLAGSVRRRRPAWIRARRSRRALRRARRTLLQDRTTGPDACCAILRAFLAERWNLASASMTPDEARDALRNCGVTPAAAEGLALELRRHFEASFSGAATAIGAETRDRLYNVMRDANRAEARPC